MKRLNLYITKQLLITTLIGLVILTFILLSGNLMKASELLAKGVPLSGLLRSFLFMIPYMLSYALPLAWLCAAVLVFSWLSAGQEITAMRASGISLWQIVSPALTFSIFLSVGCIILQGSVVPTYQLKADRLKDTVSIGNPTEILEPGRFVKFSNFIVYAEQKDGEDLRGVHVYSLDKQGRVERDITARQGRLSYNSAEETLNLKLKDATIITSGKDSSDQTGQERDNVQTLAGRDATIPVDLSGRTDQKKLTRDLEYMSFKDLIGAVHVFADRGREVSPVYVELHTRLSLALSPFALLLVGIPCGIRTRRRETSIGLAVCLFLALFFYMFLVCAEALKDHAEWYPALFAWVPNIVYQIGGLCGIIWISRH